MLNCKINGTVHIFLQSFWSCSSTYMKFYLINSSRKILHNATEGATTPPSVTNPAPVSNQCEPNGQCIPDRECGPYTPWDQLGPFYEVWGFWGFQNVKIFLGVFKMWSIIVVVAKPSVSLIRSWVALSFLVVRPTLVTSPPISFAEL